MRRSDHGKRLRAAYRCAMCAVPFLVLAPRLVLSQKPAADAVVIAVSPGGNDAGPGTRQKPFQTLERAQRAVRQWNADHDVTVELADGTYRISKPLIITAQDGGAKTHHVLWAAADGAHPVISGAIQITGWKIFDRARGIYVASTPPGLDSRQLWANDELARRAAIEI